jgi:hypothetical protein
LDLFPLPSPTLAASLCDLCIPTPTPAFIGLLKPYGGLSPLIGGSSYLLGMVVALSYPTFNIKFHTLIYKGLEYVGLYPKKLRC